MSGSTATFTHTSSPPLLFLAGCVCVAYWALLLDAAAVTLTCHDGVCHLERAPLVQVNGVFGCLRGLGQAAARDARVFDSARLQLADVRTIRRKRGADYELRVLVASDDDPFTPEALPLHTFSTRRAADSHAVRINAAIDTAAVGATSPAAEPVDKHGFVTATLGALGLAMPSSAESIDEHGFLSAPLGALGLAPPRARAPLSFAPLIDLRIDRTSTDEWILLASLVAAGAVAALWPYRERLTVDAASGVVVAERRALLGSHVALCVPVTSVAGARETHDVHHTGRGAARRAVDVWGVELTARDNGAGHGRAPPPGLPLALRLGAKTKDRRANERLIERVNGALAAARGRAQRLEQACSALPGGSSVAAARRVVAPRRDDDAARRRAVAHPLVKLAAMQATGALVGTLADVPSLVALKGTCSAFGDPSRNPMVERRSSLVNSMVAASHGSAGDAALRMRMMMDALAEPV